MPDGTSDRLSPEAFANLMIRPSKGVSNRLAGPGYEMVRRAARRRPSEAVSAPKAFHRTIQAKLLSRRCNRYRVQLRDCTQPWDWMRIGWAAAEVGAGPAPSTHHTFGGNVTYRVQQHNTTWDDTVVAEIVAEATPRKRGGQVSLGGGM